MHFRHTSGSWTVFLPVSSRGGYRLIFFGRHVARRSSSNPVPRQVDEVVPRRRVRSTTTTTTTSSSTVEVAVERCLNVADREDARSGWSHEDGQRPSSQTQAVAAPGRRELDGERSSFLFFFFFSFPVCHVISCFRPFAFFSSHRCGLPSANVTTVLVGLDHADRRSVAVLSVTPTWFSVYIPSRDRSISNVYKCFTFLLMCHTLNFSSCYKHPFHYVLIYYALLNVIFLLHSWSWI